MNPFDSEEFVRNALQSTNPFDFVPEECFSASAETAEPRRDSLESSGDELDHDDEEEDEDQDGCGLGSMHATGDPFLNKNRALVFMESVPPSKAGLVECKLALQEDVYEFIHVKSGRVWMRAQQRLDGFKKMDPTCRQVVIWVSPALLVANLQHDGENGVGFFEMMRELEAANEMQEELKKDNILRIGKLKSSNRGLHHQFWGTGTSHKKAMGAIDARPEYFAMKLNRNSTSCNLVLPVKTGPNIRPLKSKDLLMNRAARGDPAVRKLVGMKTSAMPSGWQFTESSDPQAYIKVAKSPSNTSEATCEFKDISPAQAFALALALTTRPTSLTSTGSLSSMLSRRIT